MLSASWRRSAAPASAGGGGGGGKPSGTVVLEALYDYTYRGADGRQVSMREGERFLLLRKSNADWWQVRRLGAPSKARPIYVPATYVTEVPVTAAPGPPPAATPSPSNARLQTRVSLTPCLPTQGSGPITVIKTFYRSMEDLNSSSAYRAPEVGPNLGAERYTTLPLPRPANSTSPLTGRLLAPRGPACASPMSRSRSSGNLPQNPYEQNPGRVSVPVSSRPTKFYSQWDMASQASTQAAGLCHMPQETQSHGNLHWVRQQAGPPSPAPGQRPLQVLGLWEQYQDPASARCFYVSSVSGERSWKPPRRGRGQASPMQAGSFTHNINHLSLAVPSLGKGTRDMDRAPSSDTLSNTSLNSDDVQHPFAPPGETGRPSRIRPSALPLLQDAEGHFCVHLSGHVTSGDMEQPSPDSCVDGSESIITPELEKAGMLNKTKIAEGGRKLRKNWSPSWVVLVGNSLVFFKDPKSQTPSSWRPGNSKPESSVDLRGAQLHWANELSSRKNVFRLRTVTGNEFLLQSETDSVIAEWFNTLQSVIDRLDRENPLDNVLLYSLRRSGSMDMLDHSGDEDEGRSGHRSSLPRSVSNLETSEKKRVKSRLRKFIQKRPPLQTLQEKGLIKDQVFGCRLETLCERERSTVPRFVKICTEAVEKRGLETDGIYRVSGNLAVIQKLRFTVNHEEKLNLDHIQWEDIHVITGALKLFFRELPEPLVPYSLFTDIVEAVKIPDYQDKVDRLKSLVGSMPRPNHDTMNFMLQHLRRVMEHSDTNRMTTQNIGIVFGPTLMRPEKDTINMAVNMVYQNQAVELMLREFSQVFGPEDAEAP